MRDYYFLCKIIVKLLPRLFLNHFCVNFRTLVFFFFSSSLLAVKSVILRMYVQILFSNSNGSILHLRRNRNPPWTLPWGKSRETSRKGCNESKAGICRSIWAPGQIHSGGCVSTRRTDVWKLKSTAAGGSMRSILWIRNVLVGQISNPRPAVHISINLR